MNTTYAEQETRDIAKQVLAHAVAQTDGSAATVIALSGDLGAGKTTLAKAIAAELGIGDTVISPTFVIAKYYPIAGHDRFEQLVHMDAYRIASLDELHAIGWHDAVLSPKNIIMVEWSEHIADAIPAGAHLYSITHEGDNRRISYEKK